MHEPCDSLVGPCSCGAWHQPGEFKLVGDILYRYGVPAGQVDAKAIREWKNQMGERRINADDAHRKERVRQSDEELIKRMVKLPDMIGLTVAGYHVDAEQNLVIRFTDGRFLYAEYYYDSSNESGDISYSGCLPGKQMLYDAGLIDRSQYLDRLTRAEREQLDKLEAEERATLARLKAKYEPKPERNT